jgi:predicted PurR-regulated permease PerM
MQSRMASYFFFILLLVMVVIAVRLFLPFLTPLVIAAAAAVLMYPFYEDIRRVTGYGRGGSSAAGVISVFAVLVLVPLFFLVTNVYAELRTLYGVLTDESSRSQIILSLNSFSQTISDFMFGAVRPFSFDSLNVTQYLKDMVSLVFTNIDGIFNSLARVAGYLVIFLLGLFYFLRDGIAFKNRIFSWSPQLAANDEHITRTLKHAIYSVFAGTLASAVVDGISIGVSFWVFGIPAPILWGVLAALASLVPGFGVSLLVIPGTVYFLFQGNYLFALGILIWGYLTIFLVDHVLGPTLVNRGLKIHPFVILLSVLGGLLLFGITGFIMGPLVLVFLFTLLEAHRNSGIVTANVDENK